MAGDGIDDTLPNMTPERWRQVKAIFEQAVELAGEEQRKLLDAACGGDATMMREVLSLLEADSASGDLLEHPPVMNAGPCVLECSKCGLCLEHSAREEILRACPAD